MKYKKTCNYCKKSFTTYHKDVKFCSRKCYGLNKRKVNEYCIYENYAEIIINSKNGLVKTKIDIEDIEKCKKYKWNYKYVKNKTPYIQTNLHKEDCIGKNKTIPLHRFLVECPVGLEIDHINQDPFDNRKQNLRCVDRITNIRNKKIKENQNIYWNNRQNKYQVSVRIENKNISGGYFSDIEEARKKAKEMREKYFKSGRIFRHY